MSGLKKCRGVPARSVGGGAGELRFEGFEVLVRYSMSHAVGVCHEYVPSDAHVGTPIWVPLCDSCVSTRAHDDTRPCAVPLCDEIPCILDYFHNSFPPSTFLSQHIC